MPTSSPAPSAARPCVYINMPLPERLLIGLSGGADSMALAYLLLSRRDRGETELCAVHVNHGLRGADADADEAFVREWCQRWQLPLLVYRAQPPQNPGEDWARQARYGFYRQAMAQFRASHIALAHHRDDQAETFLLHLLRGAGLTGLSGMASESSVLGVQVIRPLLEYSRQELQTLLLQNRIPWREDASNQDKRYLRNAVRHDLLPLMEQLAPGATGRIASAAVLLREDALALDRAAETFLAQYGKERYLLLEPLRQLEKGLMHRVLRLWWQRYAGSGMQERSLSRQQTEALAALTDAPAGSQCNLPGDHHGYRGWTHLHLVGKPAQLFDYEMEGLHAFEGHGDGLFTQAMPLSMYVQCEIRSRQPGDWITPFGLKGSMPLKEYLIAKQVDAPFRDGVPLLCRGSEVLMIPGVGVGGIPPMSKKEQHIMLRWTGDMPWAQR